MTLQTPNKKEKAQEAMNQVVLKEITYLKELYNRCMKTGNIYGALTTLDKLALIGVEDNDERYVMEIASNLYIYLSPEFKYENYVNQYQARRVSDVSLFYLFQEMKRKSFHQSFVPSRTLLTPHRRRQLDKTANAEPRIFGYGFNNMNCLGVPSPNNAFIDIPTEINVPPVYEVRMSTSHSVFWCHDGRFFAAGDARNFMINLPSKDEPILFHVPKEIDLRVKMGELITGFKCLECGTLFETTRRWYFVGDYVQAHDYLKALHNTNFELATDVEPPSDNFWVSNTRPRVSCMYPKLDDPRNAVPIKLLGITYMIKVFPSYWTEMNPGHVKRRPVCFLLNGIEVKDVRIDNVGSNNILWVLHEKVLYHGHMMPMFKDENNGDETNLDNYIMLVELHEYRTASPYTCTGVVANNDNGVIFKCGDLPDNGFDHMKLAENRYRGYVHKYMFETVEMYKDTAHKDSRYMSHQKKSTIEFTVDSVIKEANVIFKSKQMEEPIKADWLGRTLKEYRWSNFYSFLCYISMPRIFGGLSKCFLTDIDSMIESENVEFIARHRIKQLFEEFERVNYPGTDVWKPVEFLRVHTEPIEDFTSEEKYRADAVKWAVKEFIRRITDSKSHEDFNPENKVNKIIIEYIINTIWCAHDLWSVMNNEDEPPSEDDALVKFLEDSETTIPDGNLLYETMNPGKILENRKREGIQIEKELEEDLNIRMTFLMEHRDPTLKPTRFNIMTCTFFLKVQNPYLLPFVDSEKVLDLNKVYPNDKKLHRLIVQTHFFAHGYTDFEGLQQYEDTTFKSLGYQLVTCQKYLKRSQQRYSGYLAHLLDFPVTQVVALSPLTSDYLPIKTKCGNSVYVHRFMRNFFSTLKPDEEFPSTLTAPLMVIAWQGLLNRSELDFLKVKERVEIAHWFKEAKMHEAFVDQLKHCLLDASAKTDVKQIRELVSAYPTIMRRLIAQYRPGILFWYHVPLPSPMIQHVKIIMEMFPKNDHGRHPRVPRKVIVKPDGTEEKTVFHQIGSRELRKWYTNDEERRAPRFSKSMAADFPLDYPYKPFLPATERAIPVPTIGSMAPMLPERRKYFVSATTTVVPTKAPVKSVTKTPQEIKEEQQKIYRQELQRLAENRAANSSRVRKTKKNRKR
uniref:RING-type domain-containing protein n=1 Tax=Caenorhabditis tropicalis TaxID=1561998 RepID=A0A1I7T634_9PELO